MRTCFLLSNPYQWPVSRLPHLFPNPLFQLRLVLRNPLLRCHTLFNCLPDDRCSDMDAYFSDVCDVGDETSLGVLEARGLGREGFDGCDKHGGGQEAGAREHCAKADTRERGGVVTFGYQNQRLLAHLHYNISWHGYLLDTYALHPHQPRQRRRLTNFIFLPLILNWRKWTASRN